MDDLISRQDAIDALMEKDKKLRNINWYDKPYAEGECRGIDEALSIISSLPPAQPERDIPHGEVKTHETFWESFVTITVLMALLILVYIVLSVTI